MSTNKETTKQQIKDLVGKPVSLTQARKIVPNWRHLKIQARYLKFAAEWLLNGHNATDAYMRHCAAPGTMRSSATVEASRVLARTEVQQAIKFVLEESIGKIKADLEDKILNTLWRRAFYDPAQFLTTDGEPKFNHLEDVPEEWRCCIEGIESQYFGKDADQKVIKIKLADRDKAMDRLAKYIDLFRERDAKKIDLGKESLDALTSMVRGFHEQAVNPRGRQQDDDDGPEPTDGE